MPSGRLLQVALASAVILAATLAVAAVTLLEPERPAALPLTTSRLVYLGGETFEPTLGVDKQGRIFYSMTPNGGPAIGWEAEVWRSLDGGLTFHDISPRLQGTPLPPETNDPMIYVDYDTGRVFQFSMSPILTCSILSWSDDQGESWETNPRGCAHPPPWDHQSMVAAKPRGVATAGYPNVLIQCVNAVYAVQCARSLDGGSDWHALPPAYVNRDLAEACSALHGHPAAAPDGTVMVPFLRCFTEPSVLITRDSGTSWTRVVVSSVAGVDGPDSAVAFDEAGNAYHAWVDEAGRVQVAVSRDGGTTWGPPMAASPAGVTANLPTLAAGAEGRIVLAYAGTRDLPAGYATDWYPRDREKLAAVTWHGFMTVTLDALAATPVYQTTQVNPEADPLVRRACGPGRCPGMVDFIDVVVGPDGAAHAAFVDACTAICASDPQRNNNAGEALLASLAAAGLR